MEQDTLHTFDAYSHGELNEPEKLAFEEKLKADEELRKEFEEYVNIVSGIHEYEREKIKTFIRDSRMRQLSRTSNWNAFKRVAVAAAIILVVLIPTYVIFRITTQSSRLANEFYIEDPGLPVVMGASSHSVLDQAMIDFKDKQYSESLTKILLLQAEKPGNDTLHYYAGLCNYETNQNEEAIQNFLMITEPESAFYYRAKYNLALCYLKTGQSESALHALQSVSSQASGELKKKAAELMKKL